MKISIYHIDQGFVHTKYMLPVMAGVLTTWSEAAGHQARLLVCPDDQAAPDLDADVAAFCVYTHVAPAVYRLADQLRRNGVVVILGGPHFQCQMTVDEGLRHADVVAPSINEEQWLGFLSHVERKRLPAGGAGCVIRDHDHQFRLPVHFYRTYRHTRLLEFPLVYTTLGCPYRCEYCTPLMPGTYLLRDVETIYRELSEINGRTVVFADATFGLNRKHTVELMRAIAPLEKNIFVETTLARLDDDELLDACAEGGVKWIAAGIETLSGDHQKHGRNQLDGSLGRLKEIIDKIDSRGIMVQGNFIIGTDDDDQQSDELIYELYRTTRMSTIYIDLLVPYPSSELFRRLDEQGRILDRDWSHYDFEHIVFRPQGASAEQLVERFISLSKRLMSGRLLLAKIGQVLTTAGICKAAMNMVLWNIHKTLDAPARARRLRRNLERSRRLAAQSADHGSTHELMSKLPVEDGVTDTTMVG
jgi:hypothetical protein